MTRELEGQRVLQSFFNGANELIEKKDELNKINVFPVADGDTGSNLASLMQTILDSVAPNTTSVEVVLNNVADAALLGARGNSGIIFAQYLNGIAHFFDQTEKTARGFVQALNQAVSEAYQALLEPKEGTILTVIRIWAKEVQQTFTVEESLEKALLSAREKALEALKQTEFQMDVLRKNRLVDSGAKGFYIFIDGFTATFANQLKTISEVTEEARETVFETENITEKPTYRYCTELLLKEVTVEKSQLKSSLENMGDSLILAGSQRLLKIHIHTNQPQEVVEKIRGYGQLAQQKVDDMLLQFEVTKQRKYPIALITDSVADIPAEFLLEEQVHVLPMNILIDDASYLDKLTIDSTLLKTKEATSQKMSTAQPTVRSVDALLSFLENKYEAILVITVAAQLSGTYQLIKQRTAAKNFSPEKFQIIDSQLNSAAQGLLVKAAVEQIKAGNPLADIVTEIQAIQQRSFIYVAVADLGPMLRSGRIPKGVGKIAQLLHVYPIVSLNAEGEGKLSGVAFSQRQSEAKILKKIKRLVTQNKIERLAITHADNQAEAEKVQRKLQQNQESLVDYVVASSAAIAISAGIGSVAIAGIMKEEKE